MKTITKEDVREQNIKNQKEVTIAFDTPLHPQGEMGVKDTGKGTRPVIFTNEMAQRASALPKGEMMIEGDVKAFAKQAAVDISLGSFENPTVYQHIYDIIKNPDFPAQVKVRDIIGLQAAFAIVNEGESVPLADFKLGSTEMVDLKIYSAGYKIGEYEALFKQLWKVPQLNKALGIAYNASLDHIHLSPIIKATYSAKQSTAKVSGGSSDLETVWKTLRKGIKDALSRRNASGYRLRPTIALCNSATAMDVQSAVKGLVEKGSQLGSLGQIKTVLAYDGWEGEINKKKVTFDAPADNVVYLIEPKNTFKSLVKKDLTHLEQMGSVMTLSKLEVAKMFALAPIAGVADAVHKVTVA